MPASQDTGQASPPILLSPSTIPHHGPNLSTPPCCLLTEWHPTAQHPNTPHLPPSLCQPMLSRSVGMNALIPPPDHL